MATETDKELLEENALYQTDPFNSKLETDGNLGHEMEKYCGSVIKVSQGKELEISFLAPLAEANPQVATENDEKFKKIGYYGKLDFQPEQLKW